MAELQKVLLMLKMSLSAPEFFPEVPIVKPAICIVIKGKIF